MDRRVRVREVDRRATRPADTSRPHPRDEWRQLSPQAKQAATAADVNPLRSACHGARCPEGPVLAMLPRIKSGVRVAPRLPSPSLRAAAIGPQVGTGKLVHQSNWKADFTPAA